ncbi:hypothetical protein TanjilG_20396 [Lupinus angustifolius]|uniref:Teneurin NHL domain-containing protein n=1 Tax=Lupinus angustifolius TaxID=3871 RepID=A0A4P1RWD4_LUPAN|nr:hypothetical protein TanjilG_20396 [Lupinus angustifolius]
MGIHLLLLYHTLLLLFFTLSVSAAPSTTSPATVSSRSMMKFDSGYNVETVFDGSKLGIEAYAIEVFPNGELLILDSANSNVYKISSSLSLYSRPKLVAGSAQGYSGHVDGKAGEARMSHPKGITVDDRGNIYVADTSNMAIRKISDSGMAMLAGAGFFGYMLAMLQRRLGTIVAIRDDKTEVPAMPLKSVSPPLVPSACQPHKLEEGFLDSLRKLIANTGSSMVEVMVGLIPGFGKNPQSMLQPPQKQQANAWPVQESFVIPNEDQPPSIDTRSPTPRKTYAFMSKDAEKMRQLQQSKAFYSGWDGDVQQPQQKHHHRHEYSSSIPHTYYEQSHETTNEIVFGAVQEQNAKQESVVSKPVDYGASLYNDHHNIRSRMSSMGYTCKY